VFPSVSIKDRPSVPDTSAIPLWKRITLHSEWRDGESSMYPPYWNRVGRWSTVLSGGTNPSLFWRIQEKVDICRSGTCICRVVGNPQLGLIVSNRHCSSVMETQFSTLHHS
jgi:hypothetical protein